MESDVLCKSCSVKPQWRICALFNSAYTGSMCGALTKTSVVAMCFSAENLFDITLERKLINGSSAANAKHGFYIFREVTNGKITIYNAMIRAAAHHFSSVCGSLIDEGLRLGLGFFTYVSNDNLMSLP